MQIVQQMVEMNFYIFSTNPLSFVPDCISQRSEKYLISQSPIILINLDIKSHAD